MKLICPVLLTNISSTIINQTKMNGNKFKGNKQKKSGRGRKEVYSEFDPNTDQYGKIVTMEGGKGVSVIILNSPDGKPIHVAIRGIHHKKVWFKKEDLVVVRGSEIWGKVSDGEMNRVRRYFDIFEGRGDNGMVMFRDNGMEDDEEESTPSKKFITTDADDNETINFDDI